MTIPSSMTPQAVAQAALDSPWKAWNEVERLMQLPAMRILFAVSGVPWPYALRAYGYPILQKHRQSTMYLGARAWLRSTVRSNPLGANHPCVLSTRRPGAVLTIGDDFGMTGGAIVCEESITIGDRVWVGANCTILDTDFHPLKPVARQANPSAGKTAPITIENDVFIGMQVIVLKGVTLGAGCVIGAGSVVTHDIAPGVIAAGNPARVVGEV